MGLFNTGKHKITFECGHSTYNHFLPFIRNIPNTDTYERICHICSLEKLNDESQDNLSDGE